MRPISFIASMVYGIGRAALVRPAMVRLLTNHPFAPACLTASRRQGRTATTIPARRQAILTVIFIFLSYLLPAQPFSHVTIRSYNTENGLSSNGIKGLEWEEKTGFLWIATEAGVIRFNGISFEEATGPQEASTGPRRMTMMVRNNQGEIFTADEVGNVFKVNKNLLQLWRNAAEVKGKTNKLYYLAVSTPFYQAMDAKSNPFLLERHKMIPAGDTACWITDNKILYYVTPTLLRRVFDFNGAARLFKIGADCFLAIDDKIVYQLGKDGGDVSPVPVTNEAGAPASLAADQKAIFWQNGLPNPVLIDGSNASLLQYTGGRIIISPLFSNLPASPLVRFIQYSPKNKTLFIGTDSRGIIIISANPTLMVRRPETGIRDRNAYYAQVKLPGNRVLTNEGHVLGAAGGEAPPIPGIFEVWTFKAGDTALWYFQQNKRYQVNCLHRYDYRSGHITAFPGTSNIDIGAITAAEGQVYVANKKGIGKLVNDSLEYLHLYPSIQVQNTTYALAAAPGILLAANCHGLLRLNTATRRLDTVISSGDICFRSIWQHRGYTFLGTYGGGYYIWKGNRILPMPLDKNKYLLYAHCFMPDGNGYCWISTNRGLFRVLIDDMISAFENKRPRIYYHYYGKNDGMDITEMNGGCMPCALELDDATISFPTMDGLLWVNPRTAGYVLPDGDIFIDGITVDGQPVDAARFSTRALPAQTGEIVIRPGFSGWCNEENIYLEYRLNNSGAWMPVDVSGAPAIKLSNLPPGRYQLQIRKLNGFGQSNFAITQLTFSITTPWYRQWWFFVLAALLVFGVILLFFRLRTRQYKIRQRRLEAQVQEKTKELQEKNEALEKNNSIKTRLISIISHDIVTPLKFLAVAGKKLLENRRKMPDELQDETIREMTHTSQELQQLSTNILNWIKYQNENRRLTREQFHVHELVNQVLGVLQSLARQKGLQLVNRVEESETVFQYFEPLKILVYNLVANAVNFSEKGAVTISMQRNGGSALISVADEGVGMTQAQIDNVMGGEFIVSSANMDNRKGNGLGYLIIKDLLKTMGGTLQILSTEGKGTEVQVVLPVT